MTIIFFFQNILRDAHRDIFQLQRLIDEGFHVILLDATKYSDHEATAEDPLILKHKIECASLEDFYHFRDRLPDEPVLYVTFDNYLQSSAKILNLLVRKHDKLLSYHTKRISANHLPSNRAKLLGVKMIKKLDRYIPLHYLKWYYRKRYGMFVPDYFLCSTHFLIPTKVYLTVKKSHRIVVHADDINHVIGSKKAVLGNQKKIGVFLDQGIPFLHRTHPTTFSEPLPEHYLETYYKNLENTLNEMKNYLDLDEVVIALHPDAKMFSRELTGKFESFKKYMGLTKDLIRDCYVVFAHYSASINFAIFFKKPVIILEDDFLINYSPQLRHFMSFFRDKLEMTSIRMDQEVDKLDMTDVNLDLQKYENYTRQFLKDNEIQENSYFYAITKIEKDMRKMNNK